MKLKYLALLIGLVSSGAYAESTSYSVETQIQRGQVVVGEPKFVVITGEETRVSVQDKYDFAFLANPGQDGNIYLAIDLTVDGETISPRVVVKPGQPFGMSVGNTSVSMIIRSVVQSGT